MTQPRVPIFHFNTMDHELRHRFDAWHDNMGVLFDLLAPDPDRERQNGDMRARIDACNLGDAVFGVTYAQSQRFVRDERRVARDDMDHFLIQVFTAGGGTIAGQDEIVAGDILIIDLSQPHDMTNHDFENLTLVLPRALHPALSEVLEPLHGARLPNDNAMVRFMGEHLTSLWRHVPEMDIAQAITAIRGSLGLMQGWLASDGTLSERLRPETSAALGKSVRAYIDKNLRAPLTPDGLARTFRISRSQVYRIFASDDGVSRYIWERRLRKSLKMLCHPLHQRMTISAIAFECGFSSESHFSRTFRTRFGASPTQVRADAAEASRQNGGTSRAAREQLPHLGRWIQSL